MDDLTNYVHDVLDDLSKDIIQTLATPNICPKRASICRDMLETIRLYGDKDVITTDEVKTLESLLQMFKQLLYNL